MSTYQIPAQFKLTDYPFDLRNAVSNWLNTHLGKFTIPQIAKALGTEEEKVAWVLSNLCELTTPEAIVNNEDGEKYWQKTVKLKSQSPKIFNDKTLFCGRTSK
jgi:hypothetical protein